MRAEPEGLNMIEAIGAKGLRRTRNFREPCLVNLLGYIRSGIGYRHLEPCVTRELLVLAQPIYRCKTADTSFGRVGPDDVCPPGAGQGRQLSDFPGILRSFSRNALIYAETDSATCFYKVVLGAVRSSKLLIDGRRQITAFYLPGEVFGLELRSQHTFSAEATV